MLSLKWKYCFAAFAFLAIIALLPSSAFCVPPVVKTVRVLSSNPLVPHDVCSGVQTRLKGTSDVAGPNISYSWDFGDGSPAATGTVSDRYVIEAAHTYTGAVGTLYTARLTVTNTTTTEFATQNYPVLIQPCALATRVNMAIDEGLWYLHKTMVRGVSGTVPIGYWTGGAAGSGWYSNDAVNVNAFEVNGFLKTGPADDPYTETVSRGLDCLFTRLNASSIGLQSTPRGLLNPDSNGNGIGIYVGQGYPFYQGGPFVDAIVASGTPGAVAPLGGASVLGRTYRDIVQDMIDYFAWGQYDSSPAAGGWRYSANEWPDNSACQWVAIGLIPAERQWGVIVPSLVKQLNADWLAYSQGSYSAFGYTGPGYFPWGPYATTPSGMVQSAMDGIGRGNTIWDKAESYMRDNFGNCCGAYSAPKDYYYGLFSLTKSMLLHDSNNDGIAEPLKLLRSSTAGVPPMRWYDAEAGVDQGVSEAEPGIPAGIPLGLAPTDGIARTLVNDQAAGGYWSGHDVDWRQFTFETAWAIIMLRRTVVEIPPVAIAEAFPNPVMAGQVVNFTGTNSYHPDPSKQIVLWEWDLDNNGTFETSGLTASRSFPSDGSYQVTLRVTDDGTPALTDTDTITVVVMPPPVPPTANAGGPYNLCTNKTPWFLDASASVNPDEGASEPGRPPNTIIEYAWDLDGDNDFNDAFGLTPDITGMLGVGTYLIQLRVTDNSGASHPSYGGNLSDTDTAQVVVREGTDPACSCVSDLAARAKPTKADLTWTWRPGAHHYNVYRGTISGGPYLKIGVVWAPGLPGKGVYADFGLTNGTTYYWIVREAAINDAELCQSNQASATPRPR
ncbi:MAG: PKD domain-containing protein [Acidobacteria bacterium]|nr:PKD domain-containing protein [Acidobacteriota bacterium]